MPMLALQFARDSHSTRMMVERQDSPWRALRAFRNSQGQALVHLHNVSGGILSGDSLELSIAAGPGTRVQVTSVGATRVYRHRPGRPVACLSTSIRVDEGAMLEYLPDVLIPFSGSDCCQSTAVTLGPNAGFVGWEILAAGRVGSGESFHFDCFRAEYSIRSNTFPLALERYCLKPDVANPRSIARWGRFRYTATMYVCHTGLAQSRWLGVEAMLNEVAFERTSHKVRWGVSSLVAGGLVIRGLAIEAHQITAGLHMFWDRAKQELWGEPAVPPRKIN